MLGWRVFKSNPYQKKSLIGTVDEKCVNCKFTFLEHVNGACPKDEEEEDDGAVCLGCGAKSEKDCKCGDITASNY